jgi:pimeloyl-ACP methyl ester carboxylesterase
MTTRFLSRPEGRIAYELHGASGPWVVCVPALGDLRAEYRCAVPALTAAGYRVATLDVRGHGESDVGFSDYSARAVGDDVVALLDVLDARQVTIAGTSMGAAAAVWAAAERPERVAALMLLGPFVRDVPTGFAKRASFALLTRLLFAGPWGPFMWSRFYRSLYRSAVPADFEAYQQQLVRSFSEPGRMSSLAAMTRASKADCEARIAELRVPALVVMGTADPDFADPTAEAKLIASRLSGELFLVEGVGHHPHAEVPEQVLPRMLSFLAAHAH